MIKNLYLVMLMFVITSCGSSDDTDIFIPLEIQTQEDFVQVSTLQTVSIAIFSMTQIFRHLDCYQYQHQAMVMLL